MIFLRQINLTLRQHLPHDATLLVAVSGGADSMALLYFLNTFSYRQGIKAYTLHVATFDHGLRGAASAADADFVQQTATAWGLPVTVGRAQLDPTAPGIEARARTARYAFLAETAHQVGATHVLTAHHQDDQAETVLMHLLRGSSVSGLAGMRPAAPLPDDPTLTLVRPLLDIRKSDLLAYCELHAIPYRHDASNDQPNSLRNRLRLETLPHLRTLNPQISTALTRLADIAAAEDDYLTTEVARLTAAYTVSSVGRISLPLSLFRSLNLVLQRRWLHQAALQLAPEHPPDFDAIHRTAVLIAIAGVGRVGYMPGNLRAELGYTTLSLARHDAPLEPIDLELLPAGTALVLPMPGGLQTPLGWRVIVQLSTETETAVPGAPETLALWLPADAALGLRTRLPGDRIAPLGMDGKTRKLKAWLIDRKIPQAWRDQLPLLTINDMILALWIRGIWYPTQTLYLLSKNDVHLNINWTITVAKN
ncbi:MAG: tRNA lysidine(34) synthetase TilS [Armatimonadetes bacterium]|nr:tRNA lysidine(34) synthetase TilS [Anaerolineae bacterium]